MPHTSHAFHANRFVIWFTASVLTLVLAACGGGSSASGQSGFDFSVPPPGDEAGLILIAGSLAGPGAADGTGAAAQFFEPHGVAVDRSGNLYVADTANFVIRKITSAGVTATLAGIAGFSGSTDGTGPAARFGGPIGIASDTFGNLYVTDAVNHTIRRVSVEGIVTTFAGTAGIRGSADGIGLAAQFSSPTGIAIDASGNLYVADTGNHTIRKITQSGTVTTLAGAAEQAGSIDGVRNTARFFSPQGIAVDISGTLYVADTNNHTIRVLTSAGAVSTIAGAAQIIGSTDGMGVNARFYFPQGVAIDSLGNLYVADTMNHTIRKITPAGTVSTAAGVATQEGVVLGKLPGGLSKPFGIALLGVNTFALTTGNAVLRLRVP